MDITKLSFDELIKLQEEINAAIYSYEDGYLYICKIRSFGRNWIEYPTNFRLLEELSYSYNGDDGIMDIYTTNKDILTDNTDFWNYGGVYYIESKEEFEKWDKWQRSMNFVEGEEAEWKKLEEFIETYGDVQRGGWNGPTRPWTPHYSKEELAEDRKKLEEDKKDIIQPIKLFHPETDETQPEEGDI